MFRKAALISTIPLSCLLYSNRGKFTTGNFKVPFLQNEYSNVHFVDQYNGWRSFQQQIVHSPSDLFKNVEKMKESYLPSKFNELLRQEYILQEGVTWVHQCMLNSKDIKNIISLNKGVKETFPMPKYNENLVFGEKKQARIYYELDEQTAYSKLQKHYKIANNNLFDYFPKKYRIGVHGSSMLWSITNNPTFTPKDLDIRICSEEGIILSEDDFVDYVKEFEENIRACPNVTSVHGINTPEAYFGNLIDTHRRVVVIKYVADEQERELTIDFYTTHWGGFNKHHLAMVRADLEIYPKLQLHGSFSFAYALMTGMSVDVRLTINLDELKDLVKKYNTRGYNIYVAEDLKKYL